VNDFRKLCGIEAYTPVDNVAGADRAHHNDEGWETVFAAWLRTSKANKNDAVFVFSVGAVTWRRSQRQYRGRTQGSKTRGMKCSAWWDATAGTPSGSATA